MSCPWCDFPDGPPFFPSEGCPRCTPAVRPLEPGSPAVCPNGHAMDDGLFECPACGAHRPSVASGAYDDHCSECGRKLREKVSRHWPGGSGVTARYTDWLNHRRDCSRYGQAPDALKL